MKFTEEYSMLTYTVFPQNRIHTYIYCDLFNDEVHSTHIAGYLLSPFKKRKNCIRIYSFLK